MIDYDGEAETYDASRGGEARATVTAEAVERLLPEGARALVDVACGTGIVTRRLCRPRRVVLGVDRSRGMIELASGRLPHGVAFGDATRLPIGSARADAVVLIWLLHLLPDAAPVLAEGARVLRAGGVLITTVDKDEAAFSVESDVAAVTAPLRRKYAPMAADRFDRVVGLAAGHGLRPADPGVWRTVADDAEEAFEVGGGDPVGAGDLDDAAGESVLFGEFVGEGAADAERFRGGLDADDAGQGPGADGWRWNGHRWIPLTPWPSRWARLVAPVPGWLWVIGIAWLVLFGLLLPFVMETDASSATEQGALAHLQVLEVMAGIGAGSLVLWSFSLGWHRAWWAVAASIPVGTGMLLSWYVCAMFSLADPGDYTVDDAAAVGAIMVAVPTAAAVTVLLALGGGLGAGLRFIVGLPQGREPADPEGQDAQTAETA